MKKMLSAAVAIIALSGCAPSLEERIADASELCTAYGLKAGTVNHQACVIMVDQDQQFRRQQAQQEVGRALQEWGANTQAQHQYLYVR